MLRYEVHIDGSIQEDLGFAFARLNDIHLVWFLQDKTFHIEGVANDLRLVRKRDGIIRADVTGLGPLEGIIRDG